MCVKAFTEQRVVSRRETTKNNSEAIRIINIAGKSCMGKEKERHIARENCVSEQRKVRGFFFFFSHETYKNKCYCILCNSQVRHKLEKIL